jgi:prepilin-type N-terminal cleavage/methylation domain-containing protein
MDRALRMHGAPGLVGARGKISQRGFTLLEMVIVLVIIAILAAASIPAFKSAVEEHRVREDGHQLAMLVRQAMIQSAEQHRIFYIDLTKTTMTLHAEGDQAPSDAGGDIAASANPAGSGTNSDQPIADTVTQSAVDVEKTLDADNKLKLPDPNKSDGWIDVPEDGTEWTFEPGQLCPTTKVRLERGDAYLEMDFAALTGGIDTEKFYFP